MKNIFVGRARGLHEQTPNDVIKKAGYHSLPIFILLVLLICGLLSEGGQQFSLLARAFLHGHTYFLEPIGGLGQDPVIYNGHTYWDEGLFPAVTLMPFVAIFNLFGKLFYQGYIKWFYLLGIIYLIYCLAKRIGYKHEDRLFMVYAFTLGSVFIGVASVSSSWLYAQMVCTFLLFWILYEYFNKRRYWILGIISSAVFLTRFSAIPIIILPLLTIVLDKVDLKHKLRRTLQLITPLIFAIILSLCYNYARFGDPLQNGNKYQAIGNVSKLSRDMGIISIKHIPTNLYYSLIGPPTTILKNAASWSLKPPFVTNNVFGMSVFITSPYLLCFFFFKKKSYTREVIYLLIASAISALMVLSYYGVGAQQMGYRYSLDLMPEIFMAFMILYKKTNPEVSLSMKLLINLLVISNFYFLCSFLNNA
ncbi:MAG: hypothetical protein WCP00_01485 [bacterium]